LGLPFAWLLLRAGPFGYMILALVSIVAASIVAEMYERSTSRHDPQEIVIDEVVGYVIAMTWLPETAASYFAAFVAFRFFDILKPFPIRQIDRKVPGGLGTVLDDVAAGLAANLVLQVICSQTNWLGGSF
jgi:phosphatidylglycerophosphatase A